MENEIEREKIMESVAGLRDHFKRRGVGKSFRVTALAYDSESGSMGYALQGDFSTPTFPAGEIVVGVYKYGKYAEKYFQTNPIIQADPRESYDHWGSKRMILSARTKDMDFPKDLEFKLSELKSSD